MERKIMNPEKWIGRYVKGMTNWKTYQWHNEYFVCEWTGELGLLENEAYYGDYFDNLKDAKQSGYDPCYYYSEKGLYQMSQRSEAKAA